MSETGIFEMPELEAAEVLGEKISGRDLIAIDCPWPECAWAVVEAGKVIRCDLHARHKMGCTIKGGRSR